MNLFHKTVSCLFVAVLTLVLTHLAPVGADEPVNVPKPVIEAFQRKYPNTKAKGWELDSHGRWEVHFKRGGKNYRADFRRSGSWVETELSISKRSLPVAVKNAIKAQFPGETINEVEWVDSASKGRFYDVEFKRSGPNKDVEYRADGSRVR